MKNFIKRKTFIYFIVACFFYSCFQEETDLQAVIDLDPTIDETIVFEIFDSSDYLATEEVPVTGTFSFTTNYDQPDTYYVSFIASEQGQVTMAGVKIEPDINEEYLISVEPEREYVFSYTPLEIADFQTLEMLILFKNEGVYETFKSYQAVFDVQKLIPEVDIDLDFPILQDINDNYLAENKEPIDGNFEFETDFSSSDRYFLRFNTTHPGELVINSQYIDGTFDDVDIPVEPGVDYPFTFTPLEVGTNQQFSLSLLFEESDGDLMTLQNYTDLYEVQELLPDVITSTTLPFFESENLFEYNSPIEKEIIGEFEFSNSDEESVADVVVDADAYVLKVYSSHPIVLEVGSYYRSETSLSNVQIPIYEDVTRISYLPLETDDNQSFSITPQYKNLDGNYIDLLVPNPYINNNINIGMPNATLNIGFPLEFSSFTSSIISDDLSGQLSFSTDLEFEDEDRYFLRFSTTHYSSVDFSTISSLEGELSDTDTDDLIPVTHDEVYDFSYIPWEIANSQKITIELLFKEDGSDSYQVVDKYQSDIFDVVAPKVESSEMDFILFSDNDVSSSSSVNQEIYGTYYFETDLDNSNADYFLRVNSSDKIDFILGDDFVEQEQKFTDKLISIDKGKLYNFTFISRDIGENQSFSIELVYEVPEVLSSSSQSVDTNNDQYSVLETYSVIYNSDPLFPLIDVDLNFPFLLNNTHPPVQVGTIQEGDVEFEVLNLTDDEVDDGQFAFKFYSSDTVHLSVSGFDDDGSKIYDGNIDECEPDEEYTMSVTPEKASGQGFGFDIVFRSDDDQEYESVESYYTTFEAITYEIPNVQVDLISDLFPDDGDPDDIMVEIIQENNFITLEYAEDEVQDFQVYAYFSSSDLVNFRANSESSIDNGSNHYIDISNEVLNDDFFELKETTDTNRNEFWLTSNVIEPDQTLRIDIEYTLREDDEVYTGLIQSYQTVFNSVVLNTNEDITYTPQTSSDSSKTIDIFANDTIYKDFQYHSKFSFQSSFNTDGEDRYYLEFNTGNGASITIIQATDTINSNGVVSTFTTVVHPNIEYNIYITPDVPNYQAKEFQEQYYDMELQFKTTDGSLNNVKTYENNPIVANFVPNFYFPTTAPEQFDLDDEEIYGMLGEIMENQQFSIGIENDPDYNTLVHSDNFYYAIKGNTPLQIMNSKVTTTSGSDLSSESDFNLESNFNDLHQFTMNTTGLLTFDLELTEEEDESTLDIGFYYEDGDGNLHEYLETIHKEFGVRVALFNDNPDGNSGTKDGSNRTNNNKYVKVCIYDEYLGYDSEDIKETIDGSDSDVTGLRISIPSDISQKFTGYEDEDIEGFYFVFNEELSTVYGYRAFAFYANDYINDDEGDWIDWSYDGDDSRFENIYFSQNDYWFWAYITPVLGSNGYRLPSDLKVGDEAVYDVIYVINAGSTVEGSEIYLDTGLDGIKYQTGRLIIRYCGSN